MGLLIFLEFFAFFVRSLCLLSRFGLFFGIGRKRNERNKISLLNKEFKRSRNPRFQDKITKRRKQHQVQNANEL